jgi:hypothetical protein
MFFSRPLVVSIHGPRWAIVLLLAITSLGRAQWYVPESLGARVGLAFTEEKGYDLEQVEGFVDWNIPLRTESRSGWFLQPKANFALGWLGGNGGNGVVGSLGPAAVFGKRGFPLSLEGGISPTLLSRHRYGSVDFGGELQFTSYLGVDLDVWRHVRLGYRFQHMSNAGLAQPNPGLNLNMIALSYVF